MVPMGNQSCPCGLKHVCQQQGQRVSWLRRTRGRSAAQLYESAGEIPVKGVEHNDECNIETHVECHMPGYVPVLNGRSA